MTPAKFKQWLTRAKPGDEVVYAYGTISDPDKRNEKTFEAAREACAEHQVILFQRRRPMILRKDVSIDAWAHVARRVSDRAAGWLEKMETWHEDYPVEREALSWPHRGRLCRAHMTVSSDLEVL